MNINSGKVGDGFVYVPQDNYYFCNPEKTDKTYLYSDSATSCIIVILVGKDKAGDPLVALTHLSRKVRFDAFFEMVEEKFDGAVALYAQGANPAYPVQKGDNFSYDAVANVETLNEWVLGKIWYPEKDTPAPAVYLSQCTLALGVGHPNEGHGAYGINIDTNDKDYMKVSNINFVLDSSIRDKTHGLQTLFCIFGVRTGIPSLLLRSADADFTEEERKALVEGAKARNWEKLAGLSDEEILGNYSTTPDYEPAWFCENLRESSRYVIENSEN